MNQLDADALQVDTFTTTADQLAGTVAVTVDTQQVDCWSPLCMDTAGRTCTQANTAA
ncbi:MAG TPA: hypothetical protein VFH27_14375 [Longimicrobiaceae bacterium]|nr:hypothetical protein [Longimicrobiaceae bacterium]